MFTRVVELTSKSGKAKELSKTIDEKALPILKKLSIHGQTRRVLRAFLVLIFWVMCCAERQAKSPRGTGNHL